MSRSVLLFILFATSAIGSSAAPPVDPVRVVEVHYVNAAGFIDAGDGPGQTEPTLAALTRHLDTLGKRWLPPGHRLTIDVLQIDLAGHVEPAVQQPQRLRVMRGSDWPRIDLRYTLTRPDGAISQGEESLTDPSYQLHPIQGRDAGEPLRYEKRMLSQWFQARFAPTDRSAAGK